MTGPGMAGGRVVSGDCNAVCQSGHPTPHRSPLLINIQTGGGKAQFGPNQDQDRNNRRAEDTETAMIMKIQTVSTELY